MSIRSETTPGLNHIAPDLRALAAPIETLKPDPQNARMHGEKNLATIASSLREHGQQKPIVVSRDGYVAAGNGLLLAARELGWTHLARVRSKKTLAELRAFAIVDNRSGELSEWDEELLAKQLQELSASDYDIDLLGFDGTDLAELLAGGDLAGEDSEAADHVPAPPDKATTRLGDLWILGEHRLLCGDSARAEDVDRLLSGAEVHLVNTDPPYNVKVEPRSNNAIAAGLSSFAGPTTHQQMDVALGKSSRATSAKMRAKDRPLMNDFVSDVDFVRMLRAWFGNIRRVLVPGRSFYIWGGYSNIWNYPNALKECELYFSQMIIWVKEHPVLTRKDYMGNHEWCFYGWREGAGHKFFGPNNATDVWSIKKVNPQSMVHLTEKPAELAARAISFSSRPGENVLDLFGGSGSTMIGAQQTDRRAYLMELDALYCDVIVQRWEEFTGKKAERRTADGGERRGPKPWPKERAAKTPRGRTRRNKSPE
jgi:DNA modification methylase